MIFSLIFFNSNIDPIKSWKWIFSLVNDFMWICRDRKIIIGLFGGSCTVKHHNLIFHIYQYMDDLTVTVINGFF